MPNLPAIMSKLKLIHWHFRPQWGVWVRVSVGVCVRVLECVCVCVFACFCYFNHGQQGQEAKSGRAYGNKLSIFNYAHDVRKPPSWLEPPFRFSDRFSDMANTLAYSHTPIHTYNGPQIRTHWMGQAWHFGDMYMLHSISLNRAVSNVQCPTGLALSIFHCSSAALDTQQNFILNNK